jgi:glutathione S-transferase
MEIKPLCSIEEEKMEQLTLVIGNKNYSSWSLRPWLLLKYYEIPFKEILIPLFEGDYKTQILTYSLSGKVPLLAHGDVKVWESLAICEYVAELFPDKKVWPADRSARAWARSISHEMHAGFAQVRTHMPMNIRGNFPGKGRTPEVEREIVRIEEIWSDCRREFKGKGNFLFGHFTAADAMYAPVVTRFKTYGVRLSGAAQEYAEAILNLPALKEWSGAAAEEPYVIAASEKYATK